MATTTLQWEAISGYSAALAVLRVPSTRAIHTAAAASYAITEAAVIGNGQSYYTISVTEAVTGDVTLFMELAGSSIARVDFIDLTDEAVTFYAGQPVIGAAAGQVSTTSTGNDKIIYRGMDYTGTNRLIWNSASADQWSDLTGATITLYVENSAGLFTKAGVVDTPTGSQKVSVTLDDTESDDIECGVWRMQVAAELSGGNKEKLVDAKLTARNSLSI